MKRGEAAFATIQLIIFAAVLTLVALPALNAPFVPRSFVATTTTPSTQGLVLTLTLNSTSLKSGQGIKATVEEVNTLRQTNNVSASDNWPLKSATEIRGTTLNDGDCGPINFPMGLEIVSGYYTKDNASTAHPLELYGFGLTSCPAVLSEIDQYSFQASSENASIIGSCDPNPCFAYGMTASVSARGSWTSFLVFGPSFANFGPGVYTVIAGDEWGALAFTYFDVE